MLYLADQDARRPCRTLKCAPCGVARDGNESLAKGNLW